MTHNAFTSARPRGADAPAKLPTQRKSPKPITTKGTTRVMNARGLFQATLEPSHRSISIESREQGQASTDKRAALKRGISAAFNDMDGRRMVERIGHGKPK